MDTKPKKFTEADLDKVMNEVWSGYTDVPGYFASVDPIDGKGLVIIYSVKLWEESWRETIKEVSRKYLGND